MRKNILRCAYSNAMSKLYRYKQVEGQEKKNFSKFDLIKFQPKILI